MLCEKLEAGHWLYAFKVQFTILCTIKLHTKHLKKIHWLTIHLKKKSATNAALYQILYNAMFFTSHTKIREGLLIGFFNHPPALSIFCTSYNITGTRSSSSSNCCTCCILTDDPACNSSCTGTY